VARARGFGRGRGKLGLPGRLSSLNEPFVFPAEKFHSFFGGRLIDWS
jgi:hypothetical protein